VLIYQCAVFVRTGSRLSRAQRKVK
jgi:hypothetical protein